MGESLHALIIEDFENDALLIARALRQGGFDDLVYECVDTLEAMRAALEREGWDVIIADYSMPQFSGLDALRLVRDSGLDLPFIVVSGTIGEETAVNAMRLGAHDYLMKNSLARLAPAVRRELQEARIRRERRQALDALRSSEERYRKLFEMSPDAVVLLAPDGTIIDCNAAASQLGGMPRQEMLGQSFFSLGVLRDQDFPLAEQLLSRLNSGQIVKRPEMPILLRDASTRWIEVFAVGIPTQDENIALQVICRDITERKQAEDTLRRYAVELEQRVEERTAELRQTKERVETILNNSPDAILLLLSEQEISQVNRSAVKLFGYQAEEMVGRSPVELVLPEYSPMLQQALRAAFELGHPSRTEMVARSRNNHTFDVDVAVVPVHENDRVVNLVCSMRDISVLKSVERMKDAFVSNVSHELRTPITNLKLRQHLMKKQPGEFLDHLLVAQRETDRLANIIEDLLYLSRMDQMHSTWNPSSVNLNHLVAQYVEDRAALAENRQLVLHFSADSQLQEIWADEGMLGQALSALITNAINYTPPGGQVHISTRLEVVDNQEWATLNVSDNGVGIAIDEQPRLFERFFRGSAGLNSGAPGTGLGLSIVQEIVKKHQGRIDVISDGVSGHGTTFRLWLPVIPAATSRHNK